MKKVSLFSQVAVISSGIFLFSAGLLVSHATDGVFDLILLSEVVYYLSREDVGRLAASVTRSLAPDGSVILVHWTGSTDYVAV